MNMEPGIQNALIDIQGLVKAYDLLPVLRKLDLDIERGEFVALLGANGSGKSTLLRLLCGLSKSTAGVIRVGGWELPGETHAVRAQIGLVSHKPLLYENLSARENLAFFAHLYNLPTAQIEGRMNDLLQQVGLSKRGDDLVRTFSRGMQQRLSIARALLHNPDILLLDEPYTGLDQDASATLDTLLSGRARGRTHHSHVHPRPPPCGCPRHPYHHPVQRNHWLRPTRVRSGCPFTRRDLYRSHQHGNCPMKTPFRKTVWSIVRKDLRMELRSRELVSSMGLFALLSILIFSFALELDRVARGEAISGVLWVTVVFASILGLNRSLAMERDGATWMPCSSPPLTERLSSAANWSATSSSPSSSV